MPLKQAERIKLPPSEAALVKLRKLHQNLVTKPEKSQLYFFGFFTTEVDSLQPERLRLTFTHPTTEPAVAELADVLSRRVPAVETLHLDVRTTFSTAVDLQRERMAGHVLTTLRAVRHTLTTLKIDNIWENVRITSGSQVHGLLPVLKHLSLVVYLHQDRRRPGSLPPSHPPPLADVLLREAASSLISLSLSVTDYDIITRLLKPCISMPMLEVLHLSVNWRRGEWSARLAKDVLPFVPALRLLDIDDCDASMSLVHALLDAAPSLQALWLSGMAPCALPRATAPARRHGLLSLVVQSSSSSISPDCAKHWHGLLRRLPSLCELTLSGYMLHHEILAKSIASELPHLRMLVLPTVTWLSAVRVSTILPSMPSLVYLATQRLDAAGMQDVLTRSPPAHPRLFDIPLAMIDDCDVMRGLPTNSACTSAVLAAFCDADAPLELSPRESRLATRDLVTAISRLVMLRKLNLILVPDPPFRPGPAGFVADKPLLTELHLISPDLDDAFVRDLADLLRAGEAPALRSIQLQDGSFSYQSLQALIVLWHPEAKVKLLASSRAGRYGVLPPLFLPRYRPGFAVSTPLHAVGNRLSYPYALRYRGTEPGPMRLPTLLELAASRVYSRGCLGNSQFQDASVLPVELQPLQLLSHRLIPCGVCTLLTAEPRVDAVTTRCDTRLRDALAPVAAAICLACWHTRLHQRVQLFLRSLTLKRWFRVTVQCSRFFCDDTGRPHSAAQCGNYCPTCPAGHLFGRCPFPHPPVPSSSSEDEDDLDLEAFSVTDDSGADRFDDGFGFSLDVGDFPL